MSNSEVTKAPAMTPAQRQANRQARLREDVRRGREARYQVDSFRQIAQRMAALDMEVVLNPRALSYDEPLQALNEWLIAEVSACQVERQKKALKEMTRRRHIVSHEPAAPGQAEAPEKPAKERQIAATVRPSKGDAKPAKSRKRVAK